MQRLSQPSEFAIIIPAYNEETTIQNIAERALLHSSLVIIVDDGSTDKTIAMLKGLPIILIENKTNQGKAASLWSGFQVALQHNVKHIVTLDGDGQHAPEDIPKLLIKADAKPGHIIIGARLADKSVIPAKRYYANIIANFWIAWAAGYPISDSQSGFRIYPANLFDNLDICISKRNSFVFESEIIIKAAQRGIKCTAVAIPAVYANNARPSHFNGVRDITFITMMVARSLFTRGFYLKGLYNSSIKPRLLPQGDSQLNYDGYMLLLLSIAIIGLSFGLTFLIAFSYVLLTAIKTTCSSSTDNIVVLGKKLRNNLPDSAYLQRLNRALDVVCKSPDKKIYILGGLTGEAEISEARAGKIYLEKNNINASNIHIEEGSRNTLENMKQLKAGCFLNHNKLTLITNRYHLARSSMMAKKFGFDVEACAAEKSYTPGLIALLNVFTEAFHLHWYYVGCLFARLTKNKRMLSRIQ